jgi:hypothetical protein
MKTYNVFKAYQKKKLNIIGAKQILIYDYQELNALLNL